MNLKDKEYYYMRNIQGDIVGLYDVNGTVVVKYTYDSWGSLISIDGSLKDTVGVKNPYRYRGYRYDSETGLYYLQSRYYNPEWGRFINADALAGFVGEILSHNIFAYFGNNPINGADPSGFAFFNPVDDVAGDSEPPKYTINEQIESVKQSTKVNAVVGTIDNISETILGSTIKTTVKTTRQVSKYIKLDGFKVSAERRLAKRAFGIAGSILGLAKGIKDSVDKHGWSGRIIVDVGATVACVGLGIWLIPATATMGVAIGASTGIGLGVEVLARQAKSWFFGDGFWE